MRSESKNMRCHNLSLNQVNGIDFTFSAESPDKPSTCFARRNHNPMNVEEEHDRESLLLDGSRSIAVRRWDGVRQAKSEQERRAAVAEFFEPLR